ncbi:hypothetical protein PR202_ga28443 [Eleusine coracana subsp. coracana]|uniref:SCP domain-containing protein n=1 Tax=Eleusine coracana subsp. coracana TaxID=191504 RepID=A0AAV5DIR1_ELECO|nr:hypothetical protein PR202_ga28443 [Eleusine coracana subsp. coracana]
MACSSSKLACIAFLAIVATILVAPCTAQNLTQNSPKDYLDPHNAARAAVGVPPVTWDNTVAAWAQNYANSRRGDCKLVHSPSGRPRREPLRRHRRKLVGEGRREIVGGREAVLQLWQQLLHAGEGVRALQTGSVA